MPENLEWLGHASFLIRAERVIYLDPWKVSGGPPADLILISHEHRDHCSAPDVAALAGPDTIIVAPPSCGAKLGREILPATPGRSLEAAGVRIETIPAYNIGKPFHPREAGWVGYVVGAGGRRIYHAGDTDLIPEMELVRADVALLPVGGTYTMNVEEAARAAGLIRAKLTVPMHYGDITGTAADGEAFRLAAAAAVPVEVMTPSRP